MSSPSKNVNTAPTSDLNQYGRGVHEAKKVILL